MKMIRAARAAAAGLALAALTACTAGGGAGASTGTTAGGASVGPAASASASAPAPAPTSTQTSGSATATATAGTILPTPPSDWSQSATSTAFAALGADPFVGEDPTPTLRLRLTDGLKESTKTFTVGAGHRLIVYVACATPGGFSLKVTHGKQDAVGHGQDECSPVDGGPDSTRLEANAFEVLGTRDPGEVTIKVSRGSTEGAVEFGFARAK
ncbi:hypothetical protein DWB68_04750 [Galactobacter valiniphilus]|uniref:Lipoprotein n=1 Tax=Galactobacter valiniphilus TaxID=2676122 RepID=A0A399JBE0_9MICC|nr:hypothetical protein [Galactobacter valiniphilus]RII42858.1 hypothetical protein DWB68_04750 [Galactobacter valiniphilus]